MITDVVAFSIILVAIVLRRYVFFLSINLNQHTYKLCETKIMAVIEIAATNNFLSYHQSRQMPWSRFSLTGANQRLNHLLIF